MKNCNKCGQDDISVKFRHEDDKVYWSEHEKIDGLNKFTRNDRYYSADSIDDECLVYKCNTCGYRIAKEPTTQEQN